jgi:hypothetical protein
MILPLLLASAIFSKNTTESERQRIMGRFFDPPPQSMLDVKNQAVAINAEHPFTIKGELWVRPPKGHCILIRKDFNKADQRICKASPIAWEVYDLDAMGRLALTVISEEDWDEGTFLRWQTPYRVATVVLAGDQKTEEFDDIPIRKCTTRVVDDERSIILETFQGKKWTINLPEFDTPVETEQKALPNLLVNLDTKQMTAEETTKMNEQRKGKEDQGGSAPQSALAQLLTKGYKEEEKQRDTFHIQKRNAYQMESGRFTETGSPRGMNGTCRYKYIDAAGDPGSGVIECFDTDSFDSVFTLVTCFSQFKPRLKSSGK